MTPPVTLAEAIARGFPTTHGPAHQGLARPAYAFALVDGAWLPVSVPTVKESEWVSRARAHQLPAKEVSR